MVLSDDVKAIFNSMKEGVLIIDKSARIVFGNKSYLEFVSRDSGVHMSAVVGKNLRELRPGAQLPDVMRTGVPILRARRRELKDTYFVNMYPIFSGDEIIGGISIVTFFDDAEAFAEELDAAERRNQQVLARVGNVASEMTFDRIVAKGRKSAACKAYAERIAATEFPVLLISENGVGKSAYAQAIHNASSRAGGVFLSINCASFRDKFENELFGSEVGAVSGIKGGSIGLLEAAKGGTLFIDEISEIPTDIQDKLLAALQNQRFRRVGADYDIPLEARIIAASNVDLLERISTGRFRPELYYQLKTFSINIPPLRERMDDLPVLVQQILVRVGARVKKHLRITDGVLERLMDYDWPGNVRELQNVLEFSAYLAKEDMITEDCLPENIGTAVRTAGLTLSERVKTFEKNEILKTLETYGNDLAGKKAAARELGISLAGLYAKIKD